ncbi:hypothetical protein SB773_26305 [Bacillus sp. SIMBA_074]|uniref:hypothetical protein n=1 Tax=Bacillus sp. SIMBA_074 TaxID=3085812 RepID=UPI00397A8502
MRYTRNRQIGKAMKDSSWMTMKNDKISEVKTSELDHTFEWHREYNNVSIQDGDKILFIDLYEVDFCYY